MLLFVFEHITNQIETNRLRKKSLSDLKDWIAKEMTVDVAAELTKYKERIRDLIQLTTTGDVIVRKPDLTVKQRILLYLIGKVYSKTAGYSLTDTVTNKEIIDALGLKEGTAKFTLHELRGEGLVTSPEEGIHQVRFGSIALALDRYFKEGGEKRNE